MVRFSMKYTIQVEETLQKLIEVDASSVEEAEADVRGRYRQGEIVLDAADFVGAEISVVEL